MRHTLARDTGSILIVAVVALLVLGLLSVSFALLAQTETAIGLDHKQQAQAEALADAAIERAHDVLRGAAGAADGFTAWLGAPLWGGAPQTPAPYAGQGNWYRARVDNDCAALGLVPASVEDAVPCAAPATRNGVDGNGTAVLTAWAQAGAARARVRAIVAVDDPWRHVCASHRADLAGLCVAARGPGAVDALRPASPRDPHGPTVWDDLPRPYLGCSRIDPTLHADVATCAAHPGMYAAPYPTGPGVPRFVVMGPDPAVTAGVATCNPTGQRAYFGYFDCALATACDALVTSCGGATRLGCLAADDPTDVTVAPHAGRYVKVQRDGLGRITAGCLAQGGTGLVFAGALPDVDWGSPQQRFTYYVLQGTAALRGHTVHGTLVVEGDGAGADDLRLERGARVLAGPPTGGGAGWGAAQYGFPLAALIWDPGQAAAAPPRPTTDGLPQATRAALGGPGDTGADRAEVEGLVYSGGRIDLAALVLRGGVVAWAVGAQPADASYTFTGAAVSPPPGFPRLAWPGAALVRRALIACASYHDETTAATPCS